jgi:hypothetical protein
MDEAFTAWLRERYAAHSEQIGALNAEINVAYAQGQAGTQATRDLHHERRIVVAQRTELKSIAAMLGIDLRTDK